MPYDFEQAPEIGQEPGYDAQGEQYLGQQQQGPGPDQVLAGDAPPPVYQPFGQPEELELARLRQAHNGLTHQVYTDQMHRDEAVRPLNRIGARIAQLEAGKEASRQQQENMALAQASRAAAQQAVVEGTNRAYQAKFFGDGIVKHHSGVELYPSRMGPKGQEYDPVPQGDPTYLPPGLALMFGAEPGKEEVQLAPPKLDRKTRLQLFDQAAHATPWRAGETTEQNLARITANADKLVVKRQQFMVAKQRQAEVLAEQHRKENEAGLDKDHTRWLAMKEHAHKEALNLADKGKLPEGETVESYGEKRFKALADQWQQFEDLRRLERGIPTLAQRQRIALREAERQRKTLEANATPEGRAHQERLTREANKYFKTVSPEQQAKQKNIGDAIKKEFGTVPPNKKKGFWQTIGETFGQTAGMPGGT